MHTKHTHTMVAYYLQQLWFWLWIATTPILVALSLYFLTLRPAPAKPQVAAASEFRAVDFIFTALREALVLHATH